MRDSFAKFEIFEYRENEPFVILPIYSGELYTEESADRLNLHWHKELEVVYILTGHSRHYIDGRCVEGTPGNLIVVSPQSVHRIELVDPGMKSDEIQAVVLIVHTQFVRQYFPQCEFLYFSNENPKGGPEVRDQMSRLAEFAKKEQSGGCGE